MHSAPESLHPIINVPDLLKYIDIRQETSEKIGAQRTKEHQKKEIRERRKDKWGWGHKYKSK